MNINPINKGIYLFDSGFPIHTWYPITSGEIVDDINNSFENLEIQNIKKRALYFHIPFCENNICSFCTFPRKLIDNYKEVDEYVDALCSEIELKAKYGTIRNPTVTSIFFGGGTPSILNEQQILKIGNAINNNFDLSNLLEWSFENNIQSISEEKLRALKQIGVTHVRAGVQSLNPKYRNFFDLVPSTYDVKEKINILNKYFENVCIDMIYGINGQTLDEFILDIHDACSLGTKLIDFYPLSQPRGNNKLVKLFTEKNLKPKNEMQLNGYMIILKEVLKSYNYRAHNGHGFIKDTSENEGYAFEYHKSTMGYSDGDVIGFGAGASSMGQNFIFTNEANIDKYIDSIQQGNIPAVAEQTDEQAFFLKPISSHLPYFGYLEKEKVQWDKISLENIKKLKILIDKGIIFDDVDRLTMSESAWYWNHVISYYLSDKIDQNILDQAISNTNPLLYLIPNISGDK